MSAAATHGAISELLGAYSLDAVEPQEIRVIEAHVANCSLCREELDAHRQAASLLGSLPSQPPEHLWARVEQSLDRADPPPFALDLDQFRRHHQPTSRKWIGIAAVVTGCLFVAGLGLGLARNAGDDDTGSLAAARSAVSVPGARQLDLRGADGQVRAEAVLLPDGQGYVLDAGLPALPEGRTYQLWVFTTDASTPIAGGILGNDFEARSFTSVGELKAVAITEEKSGGSASPTSTPLAVGTL